MGRASSTLSSLVLATGTDLGGFYTGGQIRPTPAGGISGMFASWIVLGLLARLNRARERVPPCRCGAEHDSACEPAARPRWPGAARGRSCGLCYARRGGLWIEILPDDRGRTVLRQDFRLRWRPVSSTELIQTGE